jgi:anti-anti-sigma factor
MHITGTGQDDVLILRPTGRFDGPVVNDFRALLASNRRRERDEVAVDLDPFEFVDEQALAALADARTEPRASDGDLVPASPSGSVQIILELTGVSWDFIEVPAGEQAVPTGRVLEVVA